MTTLHWTTPLRFTLNTLLGLPPSKDVVYDDYNRMRQRIIEEAAVKHFAKRDDDPAPLYSHTVLDAGCGASSIDTFLVLSGAEVDAVDTDEAALNANANIAKRYGAHIAYSHKRIEQLITEDKRYDVILCLDVLESARDPKQLLWTLEKMLNPGGMIVIGAINKTFKAWLVHIVMSQYIYQRIGAEERYFDGFYKPWQLAELAKHSKLKVTDIYGMVFNRHQKRWERAADPDTRYLAILSR